jgi:hypothetical protein
MTDRLAPPRLTVAINGHGLWGMERDAIIAAVRECGGNKLAAAALLKISRATLYARWKDILDHPLHEDPALLVRISDNILASEAVLRRMCSHARAAAQPPLFVTRAEHALAKYYGLLTVVFICCT